MNIDNIECANSAVMLCGGEEIQQVVMLEEENQYYQEDDIAMTSEDHRKEELRAQKRSRIDEEESEWTTVTSKGKKTKAGNDSIEVYITSSEILPKQFAMAKLFQNNNIIEIEKVKYINPFKIRLDVPNEVSAQKLEKCKEFIDKGWRIYRAMEKDISYGIIKGVDLDLSNEEVFQCIECPNEIELISVMRLDRRSDTTENGWAPSECVRLCFRGGLLPAYILANGLKIKIEPYVFRVSQCTKCWRLGHIFKRCPFFKVICPKCGGNHDNCTTSNYRCVNCEGNHMAMSKTCPTYLKERKLRQIMAELNCTYKKALSVYEPSRTVQPPYIPENPTSPVFPTTCNKQFNNNEPLPRLDTPSYAHIVKTSATIHGAPNSKSRMSKPSKTQSRRTQNEEEIYRESEDLPREKDSTQQNKTISFLELLGRIKNILFMKGISIQLKIKNSAKCLFEWVISALMDYVSDWSLFNIITDIFSKNG